MDKKKEFRVRVYGKTELAILYSPHISPASALFSMMKSIKKSPGLMDALTKAGMRKWNKKLTPRQVEIVVEALGKPES